MKQESTHMNGADAKPPLRVVLADDHDMVRAGIRSLLHRIAGVQVIAEAADGHELLAVLADVEPDVVMTDIAMPGMDGIEAIARIRELKPHVKVLALSMHTRVEIVRQAVEAGACGYLMKDAPPFELESALRGVATTGRYFSPAIAQLLLQPREPSLSDLLTKRQIEVFERLALGKASKEIAYELGLSSKTVDVHRARIMERLDLKDPASLTRYAIRIGMIQA